MGILDDLEPRKNRTAELEAWIDSQSKNERDEWLEAFRRADLYSTTAIIELLAKYGLMMERNVVYRVRTKQPGYVRPR